MIYKLTGRDTSRNLLPTDKEELLLDKLKMRRSTITLAEAIKRLDFKILRGMIPWDTVLENKGTQDIWLISMYNRLRMQEWSFAMHRKSSKIGRRPHNHTELKHKNDHTRRRIPGQATWEEDKHSLCL